MNLGEINELQVVKKTDFGVYLAESADAEEKVLLPKKEVPEDTAIGDLFQVFLYRDSEDRPIATMRKPLLSIGGYAVLRVLQVTKIGAFLDWGLEKDLFLPYKEMIGKPAPGDEILVTLYLDKSSRLCASMRGIYELLSTDSPYRAGDEVTGRIYEFSKNFGTFLAVDDFYSARIPVHENTKHLKIGQTVRARVTARKPDGKLDLSIREKAYLQTDKDADAILELLEKYHGELPFNDKASPERIQEEAGMSKNAFKRAVGKLYKERIVEITDHSIRLN